MPAVSISEATAYTKEYHEVARAMIPRALGYEGSKHANSLDKVACVALVALLILGCVGAAGQIPGPALGWSTVGLGGAFLSARLLMGGDRGKRTWILCTVALSSAAVITLGALGGMGMLSTQQVGIGLIALIPTHILVVTMLINRKLKPLVEEEMERRQAPISQEDRDAGRYVEVFEQISHYGRFT